MHKTAAQRQVIEDKAKAATLANAVATETHGIENSAGSTEHTYIQRVQHCYVSIRQKCEVRSAPHTV